MLSLKCSTYVSTLIVTTTLLCGPASALADGTGGAIADSTVTGDEVTSTGGADMTTAVPSQSKKPKRPQRIHASVRSNGRAIVSPNAPKQIKAMIAAGNRLLGQPYVYGGGHRAFSSHGYDCSGSVSYLLHAADTLKRPLDSGSLLRWGRSGPGKFVTVYANAGHAYMTVAGLRMDTSAEGDHGGKSGPRWRPLKHSNRGFGRRHPAGL